MASKTPSEFKIQKAVVETCLIIAQGKHPELFLLHASLNGARVSPGQAKKLKQLGMKSGVPDLCLPVPRGGYAGLYIEMKRLKGKARDEQKYFIRQLRKNGYYACVCDSHSSAIDTIMAYIACRLPAPDFSTNDDRLIVGLHEISLPPQVCGLIANLVQERNHLAAIVEAIGDR